MKKHCSLFMVLLLLAGLEQSTNLLAQPYIIDVFAGNGTAGYTGDGAAAISAELSRPSGLAADGLGNIYISDTYNQRIRAVNLSGIISTLVSTNLAYPYELSIDNSGNVYVANWSHHIINKINTGGVMSRIAGDGRGGYSGDGGIATESELNLPSGIALDGLGNAYIADNNNNRIRVVNSSGVISTFAGNGYNSGGGYPGNGGYTGDGGPATAAELHWPSDIAIDNFGNIYISDQVNNTVRKVNPAGIISSIAGNGVSGYYGDGGPATAAELAGVTGVIVDRRGNIIVCDLFNNRVRLINLHGVISTIAGNGVAGYSGNGGPATAAELNSPQRLAMDSLGRIYFCDFNNNVVRELRPAEITGINEAISAKDEIAIFPNPNNGRCTIQTSHFQPGYYLIEIFTLTGKNIYSAKINSVNKEINLQNQPDGIYLYKVLKEDGNLAGEGKIIIEK